MNRDIILIICAWIAAIIALLVFVPRNKIRHAIVIFFFKQFITWLVGLSVAELKLIEYPVRSFAYATKSSFDFEYFVYPAICVLFNLHYPQNKKLSVQFMHFVYFCTGITVVEVALEKYTDVIKYLNWTWPITWVTLFITFFLSRKLYLWFFKLEKC